jgi:hypothetical protein
MGAINIPPPSQWFDKPLEEGVKYADPTNKSGPDLGADLGKASKDVGLPQNDPELDAQKAADEAKRLLAEAAARRTNDASTAAAKEAGTLARSKQKALASSAQGRRSTILTGPLGLISDASTARKTILGA